MPSCSSVGWDQSGISYCLKKCNFLIALEFLFHISLINLIRGTYVTLCIAQVVPLDILTTFALCKEMICSFSYICSSIEFDLVQISDSVSCQVS